MKKSLKLIISLVIAVALILIFKPNNSLANTTPDGTFTYSDSSDGTIFIYGYNGNEKNVTIPSTINSKKVTTIGGFTFYNNSTVESVTIPEGVVEIYHSTFYNCSNLKKVSIPSTVSILSSNFYQKCPNLTDYKIPAELIKVSTGDYRKAVNVTTSGVYRYDMAKEAVSETNKQRKANGQPELKIDYNMMETAMQRAAETSIYWSHTRPDNTPLNYGENIAIGTFSMNASMVVNMWMNSTGHRANILNSSYQSIGIGCYTNEFGTYWVQVFSNAPSSNTQTKSSGKMQITNTIQVMADKEYLNPIIAGLDDNITLGIQEQTSAKKAYNINNGYTDVAACIKLSDFTWKSSNNSIFTVDNNGVLTGKEEGTATLTASLGDFSKTYKVKVEYKLPFEDVPKDSWYYNEVKYTYRNGMIQGYNKKQFAPFDKLTRGQLVTILWRLEGKPNTANLNNKFTDVKSGEYFTEAIKWANSKGIVTGYGGTTKFGPGDPIIRQDLAIILNRYAKYKGKNATGTTSLTKFKDYKTVSNYAETAVKWATENGIITGNALPDGTKTIAPQANATRAEVVVMLTRYINKFGK